MLVTGSCPRQLLLKICDTFLVASEASDHVEIPEASYKSKALVHVVVHIYRRRRERKSCLFLVKTKL